MTIPQSYDLPVKFDQWFTTPPNYIEEQDEDFTIEFGDDNSTFTKQSYKTLTSAKQEAKRLFNRFGFARLIDSNGNEIERW